MKKEIRFVLSALFLPVISAFTAYVFRVLMLWAQGELFEAWNLTEKTYPYAPVWARSIADASYSIALAVGFIMAIGIGIPILTRGCKWKKASVRACVLSAVSGALAALALTGVLLLAGSVRMSPHRAPIQLASALDLALDILIAVFLAVSVRMGLYRAEKAAKSRQFRYIAYAYSGICQAVLWTGIYGFSWMAFVNHLLAGGMLMRLMEKTENPLSEIIFVSLFTLVSRRVFGYPDWLTGVYPVSENWLTGGEIGLEGSGCLFIVLVIFILSMIAVKTVDLKRFQAHRKDR
ncbi:MAG: hypothetical protein IJC48_00680 [Clostridia bacterium]|nr:hypothetical protein [Clostridia bacterium]